MSTINAARLLALGLLLTTAHPAASQLPTASVQETLTLVESWRDALQEADIALKDGRAKAAYRRADRVLGEITDRIITPGDIENLIGLALSIRAAAAVELGNEDDGIWDWQIAQQLFPGTKDLDLSSHGDAGMLLMSRPVRGPNDFKDLALFLAPQITRPEKIKAPKPKFPRGKLGTDPVSVVVQTIIGVDGRPRSPYILNSSGEPTLLLATFDRIREWRFKPATKDGKPVAVLYILTVNFKTEE